MASRIYSMIIASLLGWAALAAAVGDVPGVAVVCAALAGGLLARWALADRTAARLRRPAA